MENYDCQIESVLVKIPKEYVGDYYPYVIGFRSKYDLDHPDLPIVFPLKVDKSKEKYSLVFVNPFKRNNILDRIKFTITFN